MDYIYGTIRISKEDRYLEKKIYKFSNKSNLPSPKIDNRLDGERMYIYNVSSEHEYEFGKLLCKVVYWKAIRIKKITSIMNEVEELING